MNAKTFRTLRSIDSRGLFDSFINGFTRAETIALYKKIKEIDKQFRYFRKLFKKNAKSNYRINQSQTDTIGSITAHYSFSNFVNSKIDKEVHLKFYLKNSSGNYLAFSDSNNSTFAWKSFIEYDDWKVCLKILKELLNDHKRELRREVCFKDFADNFAPAEKEPEYNITGIDAEPKNMARAVRKTKTRRIAPVRVTEEYNYDEYEEEFPYEEEQQEYTAEDVVDRINNLETSNFDIEETQEQIDFVEKHPIVATIDVSNNRGSVTVNVPNKKKKRKGKKNGGSEQITDTNGSSEGEGGSDPGESQGTD